MTMRIETIGDATLYLGDCMDVLQDIELVDHVITDPPYFRVKNEEWDRQWKSRGEFLKWIEALTVEFERIMAPNGSLYMFASPQMAGGVECEIAKRFNVLNHIVWRKGKPLFDIQGWCHKSKKEDLRSFIPATERVIFAEHYGADNAAKGEAGYVAKCDELRGFVFEPLRAYIAGEWERAGLSKVDANIACGFSPTPGGMAARHYFGQSQWQLPTEEHYAKMKARANRNGGNFLRREYEDLRREYEDLRREYEDLRREYEDLRREYEDLRRPFDVNADCQWGDVWDFDPVRGSPGKHPCEKPLAMMAHVIRSSTREGDVILDCFAGSGSTGEAALKLGRKAVLIEKDPHWFDHACRRLDRLQSEPDLFVAPPESKPVQEALL